MYGLQLFLGISLFILTSAYELSPHGVIVNVVADNSKVELAVGGLTSFRISIAYDGSPKAINSPMIDKVTEYPEFSVIHDGTIYGIKTSFGELRLDSETGGFLMVDDKGENLTVTKKLSQKVANGTEIELSLGRSKNALFYGSGASELNPKTLPRNHSDPNVHNRGFATSHYYSTDGYAALGVSPHSYSQKDFKHYPAPWDASQKSGIVLWTIAGKHADLYLMPASTHAAGLSAYWDLTGRPSVLPRYAYGFMASKWGWKDRQYIWDMLSRFRNESFPLDAWISDFEWYTPSPDYNLPDTGEPDFADFSYNAKTFPNPIDQLKDYHEKLHLRFAGIRKPRLGNSNLLVMAKKNNWTVESTSPNMLAGVDARNLNYSRADVRDWYQRHLSDYLSDGVDFWWNDEGEAFYFDFYWWNMAEIDALTNHDPNKRFWTINRAYTPGMQRFGAITWTGDINVEWPSLQNQPGYVLNWNLAGSMYVTCDTGGFQGIEIGHILITRWYQYAVFMPVMRCHSWIHDKAHFPFLFGPEAAHAMRLALNLRYRLLPYHYSLAHQGYEAGGKPIMRPLLWEFGSDVKASKLTNQWMDGDYLMPTPVMKEDNTTTVYLPVGTWYEFNTTSLWKGPQTLHLTDVPLDHIPVYVKSGGVIPLGPVIQYSDQLPNGPLEVQIYPGKNGLFLMFEDDGESNDYKKGISKKTKFVWTDNNKTLSWTTEGSFKDNHIFTQLQAVVFFESGKKRSIVQPLNNAGHITF